MSGCLDVNLHVVLSVHAAKVDAEEAGVEPGSVAVTHIANTRLCLTEKKDEQGLIQNYQLVVLQEGGGIRHVPVL